MYTLALFHFARLTLPTFKLFRRGKRNVGHLIMRGSAVTAMLHYNPGLCVITLISAQPSSAPLPLRV